MITITVNAVAANDQQVTVSGTFGLSGNYTAGGDTVDFTGVASTLVFTPQAAQQAAAIPSNLPPLGLVEVEEQPAFGATPQGYVPFFIPGSTLANGKLWIATAFGQPPTELTGAPTAYPAGAIAETIQFRAFFNFGV